MKIINGDCIEVMAGMEANSVDAIVTDPPYNLHFMGKDWDKDLIHEKWLAEAFKILKPGGSMLVMGGTRTFHRLACAIEDTGFLIKDCLMWLYGSGFPKAQDLGKMIDKRAGVEREVVGSKIGQPGYSLAPDKGNGTYNCAVDGSLSNSEKECEITAPSSPLAKHWHGFKIGGIKPAYEPIIWAVKPPEGSYIDNVLKWGVGAVNVDECRVPLDGDKKIDGGCHRNKTPYHLGKMEQVEINQNVGRFPANVILDEEAGRLLDEQSGVNKSPAPYIQQSKSIGDVPISAEKHHDRLSTHHGDSGGASRFFYCAKASKKERNAGLEDIEKKNTHPTVKPIALMSYLIKLITREGQVVLDPFLGSGTTGISAVESKRDFIGIDKDKEYCGISKKRIESYGADIKFEEYRKESMSKVRPRILIVDGNNLAHMGHGRQVMTHEGERTEVAYLGMSMLVNNLNQFNPDRVVVVWDGGKDERRMKLAPEYKGQRRKDLTPAEEQEWKLFFKQMDNLQDVFTKLGVPQFKCPGREADDIIYSLIKMIDKSTDGVVDFIVMSTDKDFLQLLSNFDRGVDGPGVIIWNPVKKEEWTGAKFEAEFGFDVKWYLDYKALMGDPSDNLKGVKGIGEKGATLLAQEVISKQGEQYVIEDKKLIKYACMFGDNYDEFVRMKDVMKFYDIDKEEIMAGKIPTDVETPAVLQENMVGILNDYGFERFMGRLGEMLSPFEQLLFRRKD